MTFKEARAKHLEAFDREVRALRDGIQTAISRDHSSVQWPWQALERICQNIIKLNDAEDDVKE